MGIIRNVKNFIGKSLAVDNLKKQTDDVKNLAADVFAVDKSDDDKKETFEQAMQRLKLTEKDLEQRAVDFKRLMMILIIISIGISIYLIYLLFQKAWIASLGSFGILLVIIALIFRYHFWLFQIRQKRLGCTFKEWLNYFLRKNRGTIHENE